MDHLSTMSQQQIDEVKIILTDIDDTLTTDGRLTSSAYVALEKASKAGYKVIPVTGRCAGWCDHIARMWPVSGVIGESGAFFYSYNHSTKTMFHKYCQTEAVRKKNHENLSNIGKKILSSVPGTALASDQKYRLTDLAIDFAEDVPVLPPEEIHKIVDIAEQAGAVAKISSIHVNCWFGEYDKLTTSLETIEQNFGVHGALLQKHVLFVGDSPNDATMFGFFNNSVGVANVKSALDDLKESPKYVTSQHCGSGFAELVDFLLVQKSAYS